MRPIKFRAWSGRKMIYDVLAGGNTECPNVCVYDMDAVWWWHEPPEAIMQFTGLCDVNGNEIYEGDIVTDKGIVDYPSIGHIVFHEGSFMIDFYYTGMEYLRLVDVVVIGNIYQNPELLEGK